jgi:hypothetical protein
MAHLPPSLRRKDDKTMKKITLLLACLLFSALLFAPGAYAEPPSEASLDALFEASQVRKNLESLYPLIEQMGRKEIEAIRNNRPLTAAQKEVLDSVPARITALMREELGWEKMAPRYRVLYRETFTQEEVDGLIAFYRSPAGAALVKKMPVLIQQVMAMTQSMMGPLKQKMDLLIWQVIEDAKGAEPKPGA